MKSFRLLLLVMSFILAALPVSADDAIKAAVVAPFSGGGAAYGENIKAGVLMKVDEINQAGGIKGRLIEAVFFDDQCDPALAAPVADGIASNPELVGVIGHICSSAHLAAMSVYVNRGLAVISPSATSVAVSSLSKDKTGKAWAFRNIYRDDYQGLYLAKYAKEVLKLKRVAVLYDSSAYGTGLKDAFVTKAKAIRLGIAGVEAFQQRATDFTPQLKSLLAKKPDALMLCGYYEEGAQIAVQARQLGMNLPILGADGLDNAEYLEGAKEAAENTYVTTPYLPEIAGPLARDFADAFYKRYNRNVDYMSANAYDAAGILIKAIEAAGSDRKAIRDRLAGMNSLEHGFQGATGLTFFDANGDSQKPAFVKMVKGGVFVPAPQQIR